MVVGRGGGSKDCLLKSLGGFCVTNCKRTIMGCRKAIEKARRWPVFTFFTLILVAGFLTRLVFSLFCNKQNSRYYPDMTECDIIPISALNPSAPHSCHFSGCLSVRLKAALSRGGGSHFYPSAPAKALISSQSGGGAPCAY